MSECEDMAVGELSGVVAPGGEADADEFVVRALGRAQSVARMHGYTRSALPSWGLDEACPRRSLDGSNEHTAIETDGFGRLTDEENVSACAAARAATCRHANGIEVPILSTEDDPEGDLVVLRQALEGTGASWSRAPGLAVMCPCYRRANSSGVILARTIKTREQDTPAKMGSIMAKWCDIVEPQVVEHVRIETFEGHRLAVRTDFTAWIKQLQLLLPTIERRVAEEVGSGVVEQVIIRGSVALSWRKGPYVMRGRGPRADYGRQRQARLRPNVFLTARSLIRCSVSPRVRAC